MAALFKEADERLGTPDVVVYNASARAHGPIAEIDPVAVEKAVAISALGGFYVTQQAAKRMEVLGRGAILLQAQAPASKASRRHRHSRWGNLPCVAWRKARPGNGLKNFHVAHFVIDGGVRSAPADPVNSPDSTLDPDAIAQTYVDVLRQDRSAWSLEVELRPWVERF